MVEWNKGCSHPFSCCSVSRQCSKKKILIEEKRILLLTKGFGFHIAVSHFSGSNKFRFRAKNQD